MKLGAPKDWSSVRSKDNTVNPFEAKRFRLKIAFVAVAIVLLVALPLLTPYISIWKVGRIPLSPIQMLYAVLSSEIVLAVYIWGVGNWSRFEPPQGASSSSAPQMGSPPQVQPTGGARPIQQSPPPSTQKGGH